MTRLDRPDNRVFLGITGSGKSVLARHQIKAEPRVIIFDPVEEPENAKGAIIVETAGALVRVLAAGARRKRLRICWRGFGINGHGAEAFELGNRIAYAAEDLTVYWEEVDQFTDAGRPPQWCYEIVNRGRHRGLKYFAASRRPARVPRDITANATRIMAFATQEPTDLRYMRELMGPEAAAIVPTLGRYECVDFAVGSGFERKKSPFR